MPGFYGQKKIIIKIKKTGGLGGNWVKRSLGRREESYWQTMLLVSAAQPLLSPPTDSSSPLYVSHKKSPRLRGGTKVPSTSTKISDRLTGCGCRWPTITWQPSYTTSAHLLEASCSSCMLCAQWGAKIACAWREASCSDNVSSRLQLLSASRFLIDEIPDVKSYGNGIPGRPRWHA